MMPERNPVPATGWFSHLWSVWKRVGKKIGDFQARVLLTGFYFVVIGPFALLVRLASDPLALKRGSRRGWRVRGGSPGGPLERAQRQF